MSNRRHKRLSVKVTRDGVLTIEIGVDTNAFAAIASPIAWEMADDHTGRPGEIRPDALFKITSARQFALEVKSALLEEREDGSSLLTDALDAAVRKAVEEGSLYFVNKKDTP